MPGGDDIDDDADMLTSDSWYDDEYADGPTRHKVVVLIFFCPTIFVRASLGP